MLYSRLFAAIFICTAMDRRFILLYWRTLVKTILELSCYLITSIGLMFFSSTTMSGIGDYSADDYVLRNFSTMASGHLAVPKSNEVSASFVLTGLFLKLDRLLRLESTFC